MSLQRYREVINRLNQLQSGHVKLTARRQEIENGSATRTFAVQNMPTWLKAVGHEAQDLDKLHIIHIAGTKGKGSTAAYVNSMLNNCRLRTGFPRKVGLYTSPHLQSVRERIVLNSQPLSEEKFADYFEVVEKALKSAGARLPGYFRFLTIMAFHVFVKEEVDVLILEAGVGGRNDATNIVQKPTVVGVTSLEYDHILTLGPTIEKIAWHKAGIFKRGVPGFTVPQHYQSTHTILNEVARNTGTPLEIVDPETLPDGFSSWPESQRLNAALAIELARQFLVALSPVSLGAFQEILQSASHSLSEARPGGRLQRVEEGLCTWHIDGAHTTESLIAVVDWFAKSSVSTASWVPRTLIFSHESIRDSVHLLQTLSDALHLRSVVIDHAIFCTSQVDADKDNEPDIQSMNIDPANQASLITQTRHSTAWRDLNPATAVHLAASISDALAIARRKAEESGGNQILVTGSLHLAGAIQSLIPRRQGRIQDH